MDIVQDWCEVIIGFFGWWDDGSQGLRLLWFRVLLSLCVLIMMGSFGDYFEWLLVVFYLVIQLDFNFNVMNFIEVVLVFVFEGNINVVIGFL